MRTKRIILVLILAAAVAVAQTLTQKIDVSVVNVDVVVTGPDGAPVPGLTRDNFQLFEDGVAQPITNFYAVENTGAVPASATVVTPSAPQPEEPRFRRKVLVLIDNNHLSKRGRDLALKRIEEFINDSFRGGEYDWSIAAIGSRVGMVMPLTSDKTRIHSAFQQIRAGSSRSDHATFADAAARPMVDQSMPPIDMTAANWSAMNRGLSRRTEFASNSDDLERSMQAQFTTDAIVEASRAFAGASGKKVVLLITDDPGLNDIASSQSTPPSVNGDQRAIVQRTITPELMTISRDIARLRSKIIEEANGSNVSFYIINPEGLNPGVDVGEETKPLTNNQAVFWLADQTGGRLMPGNNAVDALKVFDTASSNFYSLGFRPAHDDGKYHRLTVKLNKSGDFKLRYRAGYSNVTVDAQLVRSLQSQMTVSMENSALPVTLITETPDPQQKQRDAVLVPFQAKVPISSLQFLPAGDKWNARLDIYVSVFDAAGRNLVLKRYTTSATAESANPDPAGTFVYRNGVMLRKGQTHRIVVAIRDQATDAVGMADRTVKF